jgi:hypothetical protein
VITIRFVEPVAFFAVNRLNNTLLSMDLNERATMIDNHTVHVDKTVADYVDSILHKVDSSYQITEIFDVDRKPNGYLSPTIPSVLIRSRTM